MLTISGGLLVMNASDAKSSAMDKCRASDVDISTWSVSATICATSSGGCLFTDTSDLIGRYAPNCCNNNLKDSEYVDPAVFCCKLSGSLC